LGKSNCLAVIVVTRQQLANVRGLAVAELAEVAPLAEGPNGGNLQGFRAVLASVGNEGKIQPAPGLITKVALLALELAALPTPNQPTLPTTVPLHARLVAAAGLASLASGVTVHTDRAHHATTAHPSRFR
jgi:hypothetical protein